MPLAVAITAISSILLTVNFALAKKEFTEREKPSPFECGFDPSGSSRLPFSVQFFLVSIIFLIFDIELTLILPSIPNLFSMNIYTLSLVLGLFTLILTLGLFLEWKMKSLEWAS